MRYFRRLIWFVATRLLALCLALGLLMMGFYLAMNASNMYVIVKDGLARRAQTVMMSAPEDDLDDYFTSSFLDTDAALKMAREGTSPYQLYYTVNGFDHRVALRSVWCWPWDATATVTVEERIRAIDGRLSNAGREWANALSLSSSPPPWTAGRYRVTMVQQNGHWKIHTLAFLGEIDE